MGPMTIHVQNATFTKQLLATFLNFAFACTVKFICTVQANSANSLALSRTVQVNYTVHSNSTSKLHCSREQCNSLALFVFFFLSVCIVFVYFEQCNLLALFGCFFFYSVYSFCIFFIKKN